MGRGLAAWAADESRSRGRRVSEPPPAYRSEYQRDRDRIIHSTAFRRLMYKTQVFVNHEGDLYRTRLTHSLEVSQIGRSVAHALRLNEPLTEAICLAHDLGHTPFGHAGQDTLNACMRDHGGSDAIAYNNHDVDDGYRAGLLTMDQLREQPLFDSQYEAVRASYPGLEDRRFIYEIIRRMIGTVVNDLIQETQRRVEEAGVASIEDVRSVDGPLKRFLTRHLYGHEQKLEMTRQAQQIVQDLFAAYSENVTRMPAEFADRAAREDESGRARIIADYIAGMTDRYAMKAHEALRD